MKKILLPLLLTASIAFSAEPAKPAPKPEVYRVSFDLFGAVDTPDFNDTTELLGLGANLDLTDYLAVGVEGYGHDTHGVFVDTVAANVRYNVRLPVESKSLPYVFGGGHYNLEEETYGIQVGVGLEHRFTGRISVFGDVRMIKPLDSTEDPSALARAGLRFYLF